MTRASDGDPLFVCSLDRPTGIYWRFFVAGRARPRTAGHAGAYGGLGVHSLLALPLARDGRLAATLNVHDSGPRWWSLEDRELASDIAERAWSAVERVRAEQALRAASAHQARLLAMNEFQLQLADALRSLPDPGDIFRKSAELLGRFLGACRVLYGDYDADKQLVCYHGNYTDGTVAALNGTYPSASFGDGTPTGRTAARSLPRSALRRRWWCR